jgi:cellulose synthase/poly-beta-1,6-N-acetylglucosamine synthase-like glycosyltransferase
LISTVYNEEASIDEWGEALKAQTARPDEFVIVDGGSKDGTVDRLQRAFETGTYTKPRIIVQRCNIAEGRNLAVRNSTTEIIVSIDGGSIPDKRWLEEIVKPFREHSDVGVVGGWCPAVVRNAFQKKIERYCAAPSDGMPAGVDCSPSSRNVAFRRSAWESVGGYPEWLTLTGEDALFNTNLHYIGVRFFYQPAAAVTWEARPDLASYLKMMRSYGYGAGELGQGAFRYFCWLVTTLMPPLILFSRNPISDIPLRYVRNAASAFGWIAGRVAGHRAPDNWKRIGGVWISPEADAVKSRTV